jgi:hypothetical protein
VVLYLDFDGVLHPEDVILDTAGEPYIRSPAGAHLFENASLLEQLLEPYSQVQIILSTSWVRSVGHEKSVERLTPALAARVVGSTFMPSGSWGAPASTPRGHEVMADVRRRGLELWQWLAIDDADEAWPDYVRDNLVLSDKVLGISHPQTCAELIAKLGRFAP